jgi:hypothetical protein
MSTFTIFSSSNAALAISSVASSYTDGSAAGFFQNGAHSNIDIATNRISTNHAFSNGLAVQFSSSVGTSPAPLLSRTTYFVIYSSAGSSLQLSFTSTGVIAGAAIDLSSVTQRGGGSFSLTPVPYSATAPQPTMKFQVSNDSLTWVNVTGDFSVNSTSITAVDFNDFNYSHMAVEVRGSSNTAVRIKATINAKP